MKSDCNEASDTLYCFVNNDIYFVRLFSLSWAINSVSVLTIATDGVHSLFHTGLLKCVCTDPKEMNLNTSILSLFSKSPSV